MKSYTDPINLNISHIETNFVVNEYAYLILDKDFVFIFALVKYRPIFTMACHYKHTFVHYQ